MSLKFEPEDFEGKFGWSLTPYGYAILAQEKFEAWLKDQPVVYGNPEMEYPTNWIQKADPKTHSARLVDIQPIAKEECDHLPEALTLNFSEKTIRGPIRCLKCGIEIEYRWKAKDENS